MSLRFNVLVRHNGFILEGYSVALGKALGDPSWFCVIGGLGLGDLRDVNCYEHLFQNQF